MIYPNLLGDVSPQVDRKSKSRVVSFDKISQFLATLKL